MPYADPARKQENGAAYRAANRDAIRERDRAYYAANRGAIRERDRARYWADPEKERAYTRDRRRADPVRARAYWLWNRHKMRPAEWAAMWERQRGCCYLCGRQLAEGDYRHIHVDHDHSCCPSARSCPSCRRGLTCGQCNVAVAMAGDDPARLRLIADNLEAAQRRMTARS